jgi:hypothetical protein
MTFSSWIEGIPLVQPPVPGSKVTEVREGGQGCSNLSKEGSFLKEVPLLRQNVSKSIYQSR